MILILRWKKDKPAIINRVRYVASNPFSQKIITTIIVEALRRNRLARIDFGVKIIPDTS